MIMNQDNQKNIVGALGEKLGCDYLRAKGYTILETNYKNSHGHRLGEIDIIAKKGKNVIFVEVKTRIDLGNDTPLPEQNITRDKLRKLEKIAWHYMRERKIEGRSYMFDALAILINRGSKKAKIRHLEGIFL